MEWKALHGRNRQNRQKKDSTKEDGETTVGKARMQGSKATPAKLAAR